jgi:hypothetical protein
MGCNRVTGQKECIGQLTVNLAINDHVCTGGVLGESNCQVSLNLLTSVPLSRLIQPERNNIHWERIAGQNSLLNQYIPGVD